jgi:hypothetical protein
METAKLVIKDLIKGDAAINEIISLNKIIVLKDNQILLYQQRDSLKNEKINNLILINKNKDEQFSLERLKSVSLQNELKREKRKTVFYKASTGAILLIMLLLK